MSRTQRTFTVALWCTVVVSLLTLLAMQRWQGGRDRDLAAVRAQLRAGLPMELRPDGTIVPATQRAEPFRFAAPTFKLTDQEDRPFGSDALKGKVWTASFFFSRCQGVCPGMMGRIQSLARVTDDPDVHFVYFTVDPARDTPEMLHAYAAEAKADPKRWHMLSGDDAEMKRIAMAFHLPYSVPSEHSGKIMLVDQQGVVRGFYESRDADAMIRLAGDVKKVSKGEAIE